MTLNVKQLKLAPGRAFPLAEEIELPLGEPKGTAMAFRTQVFFQGEAVYQPEAIHLTLRIKAEVERECSRCLEHYTVSVAREEEITLREERDVGLRDDEFPYPDGAEEVDLAPYLESLILSVLGPKPLCRPDCRGICSSCGANLN
ncbi:MAG: DUF177 domain-containing protein, partial [Candidatus Bipolaricaulia bacterium]